LVKSKGGEKEAKVEKAITRKEKNPRNKWEGPSLEAKKVSKALRSGKGHRGGSVRAMRGVQRLCSGGHVLSKGGGSKGRQKKAPLGKKYGSKGGFEKMRKERGALQKRRMFEKKLKRDNA